MGGIKSEPRLRLRGSRCPETETPSLATTTGLRHREQAAGLRKLHGSLHLAIIITPTYSDHGQHQAFPDNSINVSIGSHQNRALLMPLRPDFAESSDFPNSPIAERQHVSAVQSGRHPLTGLVRWVG
ncbi:hypothetical protein LMH87_003414 [Akanthomyces muscarius]|uniref:Uncharacterized protein n=1 Tax=Akanthomyces muscarius TaxID=2231603 RepID=A0A9W8Q1D4_AKAMU|nr:hypothetical protein LMH87_003414 [Akanthomyces muscarius]KAJ4144533.1 hypothetical protein LMH87_003414 [Akanthomyces muscarius]